jgi:hypothetical protein
MIPDGGQAVKAVNEGHALLTSGHGGRRGYSCPFRGLGVVRECRS